MSTPPPPPTSAVPQVPCPLCGTPFHEPGAGPCTGCGIDLTHPAVAGIRDLDRRWRELSRQRDELVEQVAATRAAPVTPPPVWQRGAPPADRQPRRQMGVPTLLALAGVALLTAAATVFTAVAWTNLPALGQAAILLAATIMAAVAALVLERRELPTAAGALGVLAMSFASVIVIGLDRAGLVGLAEFAVPAAAVVAAGAGWALSRAGLHWVSTAAALATVVAAVTGTLAVAEAFAAPNALVSLVATACAVGAGATVPWWSDSPARWTAGVGATVWLTVAGLIGAAGLADGEAGLAAGLGVVALPTLLLIGADRWSPLALAPTPLLATAGVVAAGMRLGAEDLQLTAIAAAVLAAAAWLATDLSGPRRWPVLLGCIPAGAVTAGVGVWAVGSAGIRLAATVGDLAWDPVDPWGSATVALGGVALLAVPRLRTAVEWVVLPILLVASGAVPTAVAWPLLLAVSGAVAVARARLEWDTLAILAVAVTAIGWAASARWSLAVAAAAATALAVWLASQADAVRGRVAVGVACAGGGVAVAAAANAAGIPGDVALGAGLAVLFAGAVAAVRVGRDDPPVAGPVVAALATVVTPVAASSMRAVGLLLLVTATGWLALAVAGRRWARWVAATVGSVGSAVLVADAGIDVIEAYTVVPAVALGAAGVWWLVEDRRVGTVAALSPALTVGLVPSLVVLSAEPRALWRALGLAAAAGVLALAGVRGRWRAPTIAGAAAAAWVALTQLTIAVDVAPRWVTFAVVGALLVWLAATYERQQARTRSLVRHLGGLR